MILKNSLIVMCCLASFSLAEVKDPLEFTTPKAKLAVTKHTNRVSAAKSRFDLEVKRLKAKFDLESKDAKIELLRDLDLAMGESTKAGKLDEALKLRAAIAGLRDGSIKPVMPPNKTHRVPREAVAWKGHHYLVIDESMTWNRARLACEKLGGHLVRIDSGEESEFLTKQLSAKAKRDLYWMDGSDEVKEGTWYFTNEQPMRFFNWTKREPDNASGIQHHVYVNLKSGAWYDAAGGFRASGCVCEWDY